jgi:hypothetical protein
MPAVARAPDSRQGGGVQVSAHGRCCSSPIPGASAPVSDRRCAPATRARCLASRGPHEQIGDKRQGKMHSATRTMADDQDAAWGACDGRQPNTNVTLILRTRRSRTTKTVWRSPLSVPPRVQIRVPGFAGPQSALGSFSCSVRSDVPTLTPSLVRSRRVVVETARSLRAYRPEVGNSAVNRRRR